MKAHLIALAAAVGACHAVTVRVERRSSGAIERDDAFEPRLDRHDRYISIPSNGLVDCIDLLIHRPDAAAGFGATPCAESPELDLKPLTRAAQASASRSPDGPAVRPEAIAAFVHISDVQIREPEAKLGGEDVSATLDPLVQSFEHDYEQELLSTFVFRAIVETLNKEVIRLWDARTAEPSRDEAMPTAVIHTGDAMDAGLRSEFGDFRRIADELLIPWYQVVGNHDLLAFGNLQLVAKDAQTEMSTCHGEAWRSIACTCTAVSGLVREYLLRRPDNRGCESESVPNKYFASIPALLESVCVVHQVRGDHFLMDPYPARRYASDGKLKAPEPQVRNYTSLGAFVAAHCRDPDLCRREHALRTDPGWPAYAARPQPPAVPPSEDGRVAPVRVVDTECGTVDDRGHGRSIVNGFDLTWFAGRAPDARPDEPTPLGARNAVDLGGRLATWAGPLGYYCFELEQDPRSSFAARGNRIWMFVLNTSTSRGAFGAVERDQLRWLSERLGRIHARRPGDLVLVFAHHPIWGIDDPSQRATLLDILGRDGNVVGYFAGHTHESQLRVVHPPGGHRFWEVVAPSTLVFPQQARLVQIKILGDRGWFDVISFSPRSDNQHGEDYLVRAMDGARRDQCAQASSSCDAGRPRPPGREVTFPRLYFNLPARWPPDPTVDLEVMMREGYCRDEWTGPVWYREAVDLRFDQTSK